MSKANFQALIDVMAKLRAPDGCPWDREQTHATLKPYLIEEAYEVLHAIDEGDDEELKKELGDVLLQVIFHAQIAGEAGRFTIDDVVTTLREKLIRRHPHVFGEVKVSGRQEVLQNWEDIKAQEKAANGKPGEDKPKSVLDGVSHKMPALTEARQLTERAAYYDFDWPNAASCLEKLAEEAEELRTEIVAEPPDARRVADEVGDLLFVAVNLARLLKVDPDSALKNANRKFRRRFKYVEASLAKQGKTLRESNLEEMDRYWNEAKRALDEN
jgi:tetrapyrrole methylase family protein / MazG family protein